MTENEERQLLAAGVDPDFPVTYSLAYHDAHGHDPDEATLAEAVRLYTIEAKAKIRAHGDEQRHKAALAKDRTEQAKHTMGGRRAMLDLRRRADAGDPEAIEDLAYMRTLYEGGHPTVDLHTGAIVFHHEEVAKRAEFERDERLVEKIAARIAGASQHEVVAVLRCGPGLVAIGYRGSAQ